MKIFNIGIAVFSAIFKFAADLICAACEWIAAVSVAVRWRIPAVGIAVVMVGVVDSALASRNSLPTGDGTTIARLDAYDPNADTPLNRYRLGYSPFAITETLYSDSNGEAQVVVTSLQYARLGTWLKRYSGSSTRPIINDTLRDHVVVPPTTSAGVGTAIYHMEADLYYKRVLYYPDGELVVDFNDGSFTGGFSALGGDEDRDDDFGPGAMLPDGSGGIRPVNAGDKFVVEVSGELKHVAGGFHFGEDGWGNNKPDGLNVKDATGFFGDIATGIHPGSRFYGRFYDAADYDRTAEAPAEIAGRLYGIWDRDRNNMADGAFLGRRRDLIASLAGPPDIADTVTLGDLDAFDPAAAARSFTFRRGGAHYSITDREYRDSSGNAQVAVQSLQYAHLGVWVGGSISSSAVGDFEYQPLADNVQPPPSSAAEAVYIIEGDFVYNGARFYPDGYLKADFNSEDIDGVLSVDGDSENRYDDFGYDPWLPDGDGGWREIADDDDLVIELTGEITNGGINGFVDDRITVSKASGFFAGFREGRQRRGGFEGNFHDAAGYTDAPAELSGLIWLEDRDGNDLDGGFLGNQRKLPPASSAVTFAELNAYDNTPTALTSAEARGGKASDRSNPREALAITGKRFDDDIIDGSPQVLVQMLEYAALGVWMNGDASAVDNFLYTSLNENVVSVPSRDERLGAARYEIEGEAAYKGARFYPDGYLIADFNGGTIEGRIDVLGYETDDDFGANATLPDANGARGVEYRDNFAMLIETGGIAEDDSGKFTGSGVILAADGFFSDFSRFESINIKGRFHDETGYTGTPAEMSGYFEVKDDKEKFMRGAFLGKNQR